MKFYLIVLPLFFIISCSTNDKKKELESCKSFFTERFTKLKNGYKNASKSQYNSIDLNHFYEESNGLLNKNSYTRLKQLIKIYQDSIYLIEGKVDVNLSKKMTTLLNSKVSSCEFHYILTQIFETFYAKTSIIDGLYLPKVSIALLHDEIPILKKDSVYNFKYGLVSKSYSENANFIQINEKSLEVSTFGLTKSIIKIIEIELVNKFTDENRIYKQEFEFKIRD